MAISSSQGSRWLIRGPPFRPASAAFRRRGGRNRAEKRWEAPGGQLWQCLHAHPGGPAAPAPDAGATATARTPSP